ncbi:hypothetical protein AgCh_025609 [Apium graveolens]
MTTTSSDITIRIDGGTLAASRQALVTEFQEKDSISAGVLVDSEITSLSATTSHVDMSLPQPNRISSLFEHGAQKAIEQMNGMRISDKRVIVEPFLSKQEREMVVDRFKFMKASVKNLSNATTENQKIL